MCPRLSQLPYKTEDLAQRMLMLLPRDRTMAQDALQHPYFNTLPPPIMQLRDSKHPVPSLCPLWMHTHVLYEDKHMDDESWR